MLEALIALAALAGNTVVAAATTDAWEAARRKFAWLLGRGDQDKTKAAERRLEDTHDRLTSAAGADLERVRAALEAQWVTRLTDLLEDDAGVEAELRGVVEEEIRAQLPAETVAAANHAVAAGRDVNISASGGRGRRRGGAARGCGAAGPYPAGPGGRLAGSGPSGSFEARGQRWPATSEPRSARWYSSGRKWLSCRCRLIPARCCWQGGRSCWRTWMSGCPAVMVRGHGWWRCTGWAGRGRLVWRWSMRTAIWPRWGWRGSFHAEDPALLEAEFARLAAQLGVREVVDARDPVDSVHARLAAFRAGWLLVFDSALGQDAVQRNLCATTGKGRVLITSQSVVWAPGWAVEIPMLDTEVAAGFLVNRTGDPGGRAATDLAEGLGRAPAGAESRPRPTSTRPGSPWPGSSRCSGTARRTC